MNKKRRKTRELNQLSAYLDNALSPRQTRKLEARLTVEPDLREKLENLRSTKVVLSRLTRLKAPRNFTLTSEMVPERSRQRQPLVTSLRLASALAAVLLVVMFGAEFLLGEIRQPQILDTEAPMMEAARNAEEGTPQPLIQWGPPMGGGEAGGLGGMGGDASAMEEPMLEMEALPEEAPEEGEAPEMESLPQEQQEESEPPAAKGGDLILGIKPDRGGEIIDRSQPAFAPSQPAPLPWPDILHWAQIALAVIAVGGALALLVLRLQRRKA